MKILVVCQYYHPEPFRVSNICEELVRRGHEVQVITGYPNYPEGILYDGYGKGKKIDEVINGVKVHRCYTIPRKTGKVYRMLNYLSFAFSSKLYAASKKCVASDGKPFDVVLVNQLSPVIMAEAAITYKCKHKVDAALYCLDLWPESLVAGGIGRDSIIYKVFDKWSKRIYKKMDRIGVTSKSFIQYLSKNFGVNEKKITYLPQYAEGVFTSIPAKEQTEDGIFDFMFAGNIGEIQGVDTIIYAAEKLQTSPVRFHIVGGGTDLERLQKLTQDKGLKNVIFYGRKPLKEMPKYYAMADAMLVTMKADPVLSLTLPGKVQSYMAAGKAIIGAIDGETAKVIEDAGCGCCGRAGDVAALVKNILLYMNDNTQRRKMNENAVEYYRENFQKRKYFCVLEKYLLKQK